MVKTITREFLSERKRSFEVFIDNIRLPSFLHLASCKLWSCTCVKLGWRPWSSRVLLHPRRHLFFIVGDGEEPGAAAAVLRSSLASHSDRPAYESLCVTSSRSPNLLVPPFLFLKIETKWPRDEGWASSGEPRTYSVMGGNSNGKHTVYSFYQPLMGIYSIVYLKLWTWCSTKTSHESQASCNPERRCVDLQGWKTRGRIGLNRGHLPAL